MVKMMILVASILALALAAMEWRIHSLKRDIYFFAEKLEQSLDKMASGEASDSWENAAEDTLQSKVQDKLRRLDRIWKQKSEEAFAEKQKIKELISDISHQTKTPIANLKMYQELLQGDELSPKNLQFLRKMESQTQKLDFLLQSMVKMSRLETGIIEIHQKNGSLYETLGHAVASIVPKAEAKQIRIYVDCEEDILADHDPKWTEEAIFNILDNGVKYTEQGGSIHVSVSVQEIFTKISIRDSGKGIPLERQAEIFTRFYREPEVYDQEGVGVGLYLARKIVALQKGYIEVRSQPGQGSDFRVFLPNR